MRSMVRALPLVLLAAGCADETITGPSDLTGMLWKLRSLRTTGPAVLTLDPERYTVRFGEDGALRVRADCNVCSGLYTARTRTLSVAPLACSRVACAAGSLGDAYSSLVQGAQLYEMTGETLVLVSPEGILTYQP
jgi:heat shock protein HslJ